MNEIEDRLILGIRRISIDIEQEINTRVEPWNLTAAQCTVLLYLMDHCHEDMCATSIHRTFGLSRATISYLLKKLKEKRYISIENSVRDDRQKMITVTEKAYHLKQFMEAGTQEVQKKAFNGFDSREMELLESLHKKIIRNMEADRKLQERS